MSEEQKEDFSQPELKEDLEWKEKIAKEKEELSKQLDAAEKEQAAGEAPLPPASFAMLLSTLATQVMGALGQFPDPTGTVSFNKPLAKHLIDTIELLEQKTKGNLDQEETQMIETLLHEVRMVYVAAKPPAEAKEEKPKSNIVLP